MSEKMTCPGCNSHTSRVLDRYMEDQPCPYCGLPAEAARTVLAARSRHADDELIVKARDAMTRAAKAERELRVANWRLERVLEALEEAPPEWVTNEPEGR